MTDGNGVVRRTTRSWSRPTPARRWRCWPSRRRRSARCWARSRTRATPRCCTPTPRCCRGRAAPARRGTSVRPVDDLGRVTVTYDLTRLQRLDTETRYLVTLGGEDLVDPATVIDRMEYEHPLYTPASVAAQRRLPEIDTAAGRLRRRLPRVGLPRGRCAVGARGRGAAGASRPARASVVEEVAQQPSRNHRADRHLRDDDQAHPAHAVPAYLHPPLAHLAGRPRRPAGPRRARPVRGAATTSATRARRSARTSTASSPAHDIDLAGGRVLMAAHPRAFGYCFNPISVFWCFDRDGEQPARRRRGAQHVRRPARLPRPPRRAGPGHDAEADVRLAVPRHRRPLRARRADARASALHVAVTLHADDGEVFSASLTGTRSDARPAGAPPPRRSGARC